VVLCNDCNHKESVVRWRRGDAVPFAELLWTLVFNYTYAFACAYGENIFDR